MLLPQKCEVCGAETDGVFKLMSTAGPDKVMVRFFCDEKCYAPFVAAQNDDGGCSWCGVPVGPAGAQGPMGELYCNSECYESAGKALFHYKMKELGDL